MKGLCESCNQNRTMHKLARNRCAQCSQLIDTNSANIAVKRYRAYIRNKYGQPFKGETNK